jgi:hypothetical protein
MAWSVNAGYSWKLFAAIASSMLRIAGRGL